MFDYDEPMPDACFRETEDDAMWAAADHWNDEEKIREQDLANYSERDPKIRQSR